MYEEYTHIHPKLGEVRVQRTTEFWIFFKQANYGDDYKPWIKLGFITISGNETSLQALERFVRQNPVIYVCRPPGVPEILV